MGLLGLAYLCLLFLSCAHRAQCVDIELYLKNMSTKEKLGQLIEPIISDMAMTSTTSGIVDKSKLRTFFAEWGFGHMFAVWSPSGGPWKCNRWADAIRQIQEIVFKEMGKPPVMFSLDSVHGANFIADATIFPHNIGVAATFDLDLTFRRAYITGKDMRTCGFSGVFQPTADIGLQPLWSRHYETFGDDPYLTSVMTRATQDGLQSKTSMDPYNFNFSTKVPMSAAIEKDSIMTVAILKHWIGYSTPDSGHDRQVATVPDWMLEQYILPPFRASLSSNETFGVMINSGWTNNGTGPNKAGHANQALLTELLRHTMQSDAFLLTDFDDIQGLIQRGVASSYREATRIGVSAGVDVSLGPQPLAFLNNLLDLVQSGDITLSRIDEAVRRVLRAKVAAGLFENPYPFANSISSVGSQEDKLVAQRIVEGGITLLKNDNVLPIAYKNVPRRRILVAGPGGNQLSILSGAWTFDWQGAFNEAMFGGAGTTIFQGIKQFLSNESSDWDVQYIQGCSVEGVTDRDAALAAAAHVDLVIVAIGERPCAEMLCGIDSLELPRHQVDFVVDLKKAGKPLILLLVQGRPRYFHRALAAADAVLYLYLPGPEAGLPIAKILFGATNPSGRLPFAYPSEPGIPRLRLTRESDPPAYTNQWEFGYGLSFTTFAYSNLIVQPTYASITSLDGPPVIVSVNLTNRGQMRGAETVLLFASAKEPPGGRISGGLHLKRFVKLSLDAGKSATIEFRLYPVDFRHLISADPIVVSVQVGLQQLGHAVRGNFTLVAAEGLSFPLSFPDSIQLVSDSLSKVYFDVSDSPHIFGGDSISPVPSTPSQENIPMTSNPFPRGSVPATDMSRASSPVILLSVNALSLTLLVVTSCI